MNKIFKLLISASSKGFISALLTLFVYQFFYIEFVRSTVEDAAFDTISWFSLSKTKTDTPSANTFILMVDDKYLQSKDLLDENNETTYGYLFPREYLAEIVKKVDILVEDLDEENYPKALFIDYDLAYLSDPLNIMPSAGDIDLIETLKKERPYIVYLPMTANHNFVYRSNDKKIQELILNKKIQFISVGLTSASDNISRRYYPYERYYDNSATQTVFSNIAVALWNDAKKEPLEINSTFHQEGLGLIENRIIFKYRHILENNTSLTWQSNWNKLSAMSANYPLDMIYEEDLKDAIVMIGATHQLSSDSFEVDAFSSMLSGVEMHANALMTLHYLDGKLERLSLGYSLMLVFGIITLIDFFLGLSYQPLKNLSQAIKSDHFRRIVKFPLLGFKKLLLFITAEDEESFRDRWLIWLSMTILLVISYQLLINEKVWFNWMIPSLMSATYLVTMFLLKPFRGKN